MPLAAWYYPEDNAYVLLNTIGVPLVLKKFGSPKRKLLPGEIVESLPWDDIDTTAIITRYCIGSADDSDLKAMRYDLIAKAKTDGVVFLDGTVQSRRSDSSEEIDPW